jgi:hypothetical protein
MSETKEMKTGYSSDKRIFNEGGKGKGTTTVGGTKL